MTYRTKSTQLNSVLYTNSVS